MIPNRIFTELLDIAAMIDGERYPETSMCLQNLIAMDELPDAHEIVTELRQQDAAEEIPDYLFDFYVELYKVGIAEGRADSMNDLGALYYEGRGREPNYRKAVCFYEMAALNGDRYAQENLGYSFYYGRGVDVDYEKAFHFFLLGALEGQVVSLYKIGDMYQNGYFVPRNELEAFRIYERCMRTITDEDEENAAGPVFLRLGNCYLSGMGTNVDYETALVCFQKAESFLYKMVMSGDKMYKPSLLAAIAGQETARKQLLSNIK